MQYEVVPTKIFQHENFSHENFQIYGINQTKIGQTLLYSR